ncbi:hypothetical protein IC620_09535 [Hazenella sp. IB182357]|uniref:Tail sheath protein n=1 Tax=Polycladospora coralii TaxID=2771432 RepID=A0A926NBC6_9BACL|nr:hypothetical protein [Polycladospora coralii]MBD1372595.1 hypothetical protein [Polycladospora coralii]
MARTLGVQFNGNRKIHAGAYSRIDTEGLNHVEAEKPRRIVFLGTAAGGDPNKIHWLSGPAEARQTFRSGDLVTAGELAWKPGYDQVGAGRIGFIRVQDATASQFTHENFQFKAKDFGAWTNEIQVAWNTQGQKHQLTVTHWKDGVTEAYKNIGEIFDVKCVGDETATLVIEADETTNKATRLVVKTQGGEYAYPLGVGQYQDVQQLVSELNRIPGVEASMKPFKKLTTDQLDAVASTPLKDGYTVMAVKQDLLNQVQKSVLITLTIANGALPASLAQTALAGGTDGTVPTSWTDKLDRLYGEDAYLLVPLTADRAIQQACHQFVLRQLSEEGVTMMGVYGGGHHESIEEVSSRASSFNHPRAVVAYPGIHVFMEGEVKVLPAYLTAALIAGRIAGKDTGDPITFDAVDIVGLERNLKTLEVERLLMNGITPLEANRRHASAGYRIAQGITTHMVDSNPSFREISMHVLSDELSRELVQILEAKFVGGKGTASTVALIQNEVQSYLDRKVREDVLVEYDPKSVTVRLEGDAVYIDYSTLPVGALNYIFITTKYYKQAITV